MLQDVPDMRRNELSEKARAVLRALAKGLSYEQVLAADNTLTAHDVFRALSESPRAFGAGTSTPRAIPRRKESQSQMLCSMMLKNRN